MGGKSKSSTAQTDNSRVDNRAIQQEENSGIQVLGEGNRVYSTTTDHGAMDAATELGSDAFNAAESMAEDSVNASVDMAAGAFNLAENLGSETIHTAESLGNNAIDSALDFAQLNAKTTQSSFDFAETVALDSIDTLADSNFDNTQLMAGISSSQLKANGEQLAAITELAKSAQTGGLAAMGEQQTKLVSYVVLGSIVLLTLFVWGVKKK